MEFNGKKADIVFTIKAVESIPCDLRGQVLGFDGSGVQVSEQKRRHHQTGYNSRLHNYKPP